MLFNNFTITPVYFTIVDKPVCEWLQHISDCLSEFESYLHVDLDQHPPSLHRNLAVYMRPDRFIQCYLQTHVRKQFRDLQNFHVHYEVGTIYMAYVG